MSVKVMTAVFERYPVGGGEMILALALLMTMELEYFHL